MTAGFTWVAVCAALGALWTAAVCWRAEAGTLDTAARGVLGGLAAVGTASGIFTVLQLAGFELRWELVTRGVWPALGLALVIGVVEELGKLIGIVLALSSRAPRNVFRTTAVVAAVFAVVEAALVLRGWSWPLAVSRAAFAPVAHTALAVPFAFALAERPEASTHRRRGALRIAGALAIAAVLHGLGDWSVAQPGWGRVGFAAAMLAPVLWLYARGRLASGAVPASSPGSIRGALPAR